MFKYTRAAVSMIFDGFKKFLYWATVLGNGIYMIYLVFALCTGIGFWFVNAALLAVNVAYLIFFFIMEHKAKQAELSPEKKDDANAATAKSRGNRLFSLFKAIIQFVNLGIIIYGIAFLGNDMPPLNVILVTLMIIFLILQIVFIVLGQVIDNLKVLLEEAWEADLNESKEPLRATGNWFRRLFGKEEKEEPKPTKTKKKLDKFITKKKEVKEQQAAAKKAAKAAKKKQAKEERDAARAAKKAAKEAKTAPNSKHQKPARGKKPAANAQEEAAATKK